MSTQRRLEPHPFVPYADASHICKHCDGGEYAACHESQPLTLTCSECGRIEPLTEQVTREIAEQDGWLLGEVVYCPKCGPDEED